MTTSASVQIAPDHDLAAIIAAAGGEVSKARYEEGRLYVLDVSQSALDRALAAYDPASPPIVVPQSVSRAQAKIALHRAGLLDIVKTAVAADPETQIWFDDALTWDRPNPHIVALGDALGLDGPAIDHLFVEAAKIAA